MKQVLRLTQSLHNTPHLITQQGMDVIFDYLDRRNLGVSFEVGENGEYEDDDEGKQKPTKVGKVGIINVHGSLTYKPRESLCGEASCSYIGIMEQARMLVDLGVTTIVMDMATPGGQGSHCFEYSNALRNFCDEYEIELIAYIDEMACSAGYAYACIADEVIINPSADTGSIGVVVALLDTSKAMAQAGYKRIYVTAGANKVPFAEDGSFKQEFLNDVKKQVDLLNEEFATHVSKHTGLSVEEVLGFEAKVFSASEAKEKGLVNSIMTHEEFSAYIATKQKKKKDN